MRYALIKLLPLDALMKEQGLSDRALAEKTGLSHMMIYRLRNDHSVASEATAKKLLGALGVSDDVIDKEV